MFVHTALAHTSIYLNLSVFPHECTSQRIKDEKIVFREKVCSWEGGEKITF